MLEPPASDFPCFLACEVVEAAKRIKPNKAPGMDGTPGVIIKAVATARPEVFRETFQQSLKIDDTSLTAEGQGT